MIFQYNNKLIIILIVMLLSACASETIVQRSERYAKFSDPMKAVLSLRKELNESRNNIHLRLLLKQYESKAAEYYYHAGLAKYKKGDLSKAIEFYEQGLTAMPEHDKLVQAMNKASDHIEAHRLYNEARQNYKAGKFQNTESILISIIDLVPEYRDAKELLNKLREEGRLKNKGAAFFNDKKKISLNFRNTDIKTAFGFIATTYDFNVIFDEGVKSQTITLNTKDVSLKQALRLMLSSSKLFYKKIGNKTMLIAPDSKAKREQYEELLIKTYHLRTIPAKQMAEIIKGVLKVKKVVLNDSMNSLMIRENSTMHGLIEKMIELNDRRPAELILEVEILEVNRSKVEELGLDYGGLITTDFSQVIAGTNSFASVLSSGTTTLPSIAFRYFKQDVDAETLANPKIRVLNHKPAKIHIGDRVPLRGSTIQNPTGGTQTSFEYTDIGIRLDVNPVIHFDNSVTVKLNLEVSSLGQNVGTPEEPTYSIGTRTTQTHMLLRDGETAVIGGLIRDEDRNNQVKLPGLGDIPVIGALFKSNKDDTSRTDVLLTITPKIVRSWDIPRASLRTIHSGTEAHFSDDSIFANGVPSPRLLSSNTAMKKAVKDQTQATQAGQSGYMLSFDKSLYAPKSGEDIQIGIKVNSLKDLQQISVPILFNPELLELIELTPVSDKVADIEKQYTDNGLLVKLQLKAGAEAKDNETLFAIGLRGKQVGISYLSIKQATWNKQDGSSGGIESRAARIVIK